MSKIHCSSNLPSSTTRNDHIICFAIDIKCSCQNSHSKVNDEAIKENNRKEELDSSRNRINDLCKKLAKIEINSSGNLPFKTENISFKDPELTCDSDNDDKQIMRMKTNRLVNILKNRVENDQEVPEYEEYDNYKEKNVFESNNEKTSDNSNLDQYYDVIENNESINCNYIDNKNVLLLKSDNKPSKIDTSENIEEIYNESLIINEASNLNQNREAVGINEKECLLLIKNRTFTDNEHNSRQKINCNIPKSDNIHVLATQEHNKVSDLNNENDKDNLINRVNRDHLSSSRSSFNTISTTENDESNLKSLKDDNKYSKFATKLDNDDIICICCCCYCNKHNSTHEETNLNPYKRICRLKFKKELLDKMKKLENFKQNFKVNELRVPHNSKSNLSLNKNQYRKSRSRSSSSSRRANSCKTCLKDKNSQNVDWNHYKRHIYKLEIITKDDSIPVIGLKYKKTKNLNN